MFQPGSVLQQSVNKAMCTFFRFLKVVAVLNSEEIEENSELKMVDLLPSMFYDTTINYYDIERVGGLSSYLYKAHHLEVSRVLNIPDYISNNAHNQGRTDGAGGMDTPMPSFRTILHVGQSPMASVSVPLIRVTMPQPGTIVATTIGSSTNTGNSGGSTHRPPATAHHQTPIVPVSVPSLARDTAEAGNKTFIFTCSPRDCK